MSNTRKVILIIVIAFVVYAIFTQPDQSANTVDSGWETLKDGANSVTDFFDALLG